MSLRPQVSGDGDDDGVYIVVAFGDIPDPPMTLDERSERMTAAHRLIQAKYDAGIPFFTKDLFRDVVRQFESDGNHDRVVSVTGLDGVAVHFPLETGREYQTPMYGDDYVCIMYD